MNDNKDACFDPLLECLLFLTRKEQRPFSSSALTAGLPLIDHRLNPELFIRAAGRAGFASRVVERPLYRFSQLVLPAVLLLHDNRACLLLAFDRQNNTATIMVPESGGETSVDLETLAGEYAGYAIFIKAEHKFDDRSRESLVEKQDRHWFWSVIFRSWRIYRDVLLASLLINIFALASPLYTMNIYDRVVPNRAIETLWVMSIGFIVLMIFDLILKILRSYFIDLAGKKADTILLSRLFEHVLSMRMSHQPSSVGVFSNQIKEFDSVRNFITSTTITALVDLPFAFLFLIVMGMIGGVMAFVPLLAVPVVLAYGVLIQPALQSAVSKSYLAAGQKNATLIETLSGLETIKALEAESRVQRTWESLVGQMAVWGQKSRLLSGSVSHVTGFVQSIVTVGLVVVGVYRISAGELSMGALIACVMLGSRILVPMGQVVNLMVNYFQAKTALQSIEHIMQLPVERHEGESHLHKPDIDGSIQFNDVTFAYPGQQVPALKRVSFAINKGERVAIIGRVGSGKSTIQKLILGLYEPAEGSVLIDGLDARQLDPADLRRNIGFVPQDVVLFYGSVKENITYSVPFAEDAAMIAAADVSGTSDFVRIHPKGFDMPVGERGELLSGGQRQSIGIARALLKQPSVFLLDEPTSSMDNSTEEWIKKNIATHLEGHTTILVTHKMSMLSLVDRVIVMERGSVLADGPRDEILESLKHGKIRGRLS